MNPWSAARADNTEDITLSIETSDSLTGKAPKKLEYWTGETASFFAHYAVSGTGVNIPNAVFELCVGTENVENIKFLDSGAALSSTRHADDAQKKSCIDYTFASVQGGSAANLSFSLNFINETTPNGSTIPMTWKLKDASGTVLREVKENLVARAAEDFAPVKITEKTPYDATINGATYVEARYKAATDAQMERTPEEGVRVSYLVGLNPITDPSAPAGTGRLKPSTIKLVDRLPENAVVDDASLKNGWVYDAATHTATWEGPTPKVLTNTSPSNSEHSDANERFAVYNKRLVLLYKNAQAYEDAEHTRRKVHTNRADITVNPGLTNHKQLPVVSSDVVFLPERISSTGKTSLTKRYEHQNFLYDAQKFYQSTLWGTTEVKPGQPANDLMSWIIDVANYNDGFVSGSNIKASSFISSVRDFGLDEGMYYNAFTVTAYTLSSSDPEEKPDPAVFNSAAKTLYGVKADGQRVEIAKDVKVGQRIVIADKGRQYSELVLEFAQPFELNRTHFMMKVSAYPTDAEAALWANGTRTLKGYLNDVDAQGYVGEVQGNPTTVPNMIASSDSRSLVVKGTRQELGMHAGASFQGGVGNADSSVRYQKCEANGVPRQEWTPNNCSRVVTLSVEDTPAGNWGKSVTTVENGRQIILLPPGVEYVSTQNVRINGVYDHSYRGVNGAEPAKFPEIVPNYKGTGKTAVIYPVGDVTDSNPRVSIQLNVDVSLSAKDGSEGNLVDFYFTWDNNSSIPPASSNGRNGTPYTDALDLNTDGNTTEKFLHATHKILFEAPKEASVKKSVSLDGASWVQTAGNQEAGGDVFYQFTLRNGGVTDIRGTSLLDILPNTTDVKIAANEQGVYNPRTWQKNGLDNTPSTVKHSAFVTPLTGALEDLAENAEANKSFDYFYSTTPQGMNSSAIVNGTWMTKSQITDWSAVTAVKAVMKSGVVLEAGQEIAIVTKNKILDTAEVQALGYGSRAVNSVAMLNAGDALPLEANEVTVGLLRYAVTGVVFPDYDKDGTQNKTELGIAGRKVALLDENGAVVRDASGQPLVTTTDSKGRYSFDLQHAGTYKVRFLKSEDETVSTAGKIGDVYGNHATDLGQGASVWSPADGRVSYVDTETFTLNRTTEKAVRNAGFAVAKRDVPVHKINAETNEPMSGATFKLHWLAPLDGESAPATIPADRTLVVGADGTALFTDVPFGKYNLEETEAPEGFKKLEAPIEVTVGGAPLDGVGLNARPYIPVHNSPAIAYVVVKKTDADTGEQIAGAEFDLYKKDKSGKVADEPAYSSQPYDGEDFGTGAVLIPEVLGGTYVLREKTAPEGYVLSKEEREVVVDGTQEIIEVTFANKRQSDEPTPEPTTAEPTPTATTSPEPSEEPTTPTPSAEPTPTAEPSQPEMTPTTTPEPTPTVETASPEPTVEPTTATASPQPTVEPSTPVTTPEASVEPTAPATPTAEPSQPEVTEPATPAATESSSPGTPDPSVSSDMAIPGQMVDPSAAGAGNEPGMPNSSAASRPGVISGVLARTGAHTGTLALAGLMAALAGAAALATRRRTE